MIDISLQRNGSNQAVERTATRRAFMFRVIRTFSLSAIRGPGGRRSLYSR
jgi:hypothetical protein